MRRLPAPQLPEWLAGQIPFDRYLIEVEPRIRVHVMEQGQGRPVVMFHGNPTWGFLYRKVAEQLAGEPLRLIMPDLVGLGFSDRPPSATDHTMENHSRWMSSLLDRLELDDVIAVVVDWGGPIGMHALSRSSGSMRGLVVMNTSLTPPRPGFKPTTFHRVFSTSIGGFATRYLGLPQRVLGWAQGERKSISGIVRKAYVYPLSRRRGNDAVSALVRMVPDSMDHPTVPLLEEVSRFVSGVEVPTAIVWGDRDPVLGRLRRRHERLLPHASVTATEAGHFVPEEAPNEVAAAIRTVAA